MDLKPALVFLRLLILSATLPFLFLMKGCVTTHPALLSPTEVKPQHSPVPTPLPPPTLTPLQPSTVVLTTQPLKPTSTPFTEPTAEPFKPLMTAASFYLGSWSPDSAYFTFQTQTKDDLLKFPSTEGYIGRYPGTFHILNPATSEHCQYPDENELSIRPLHKWLPDGHLVALTQDGKLVALSQPCGGDVILLAKDLREQIYDIPVSSQDGSLLLLSGQTSCWIYNTNTKNTVSLPYCSYMASFSPHNTYLGINQSDGISNTTSIFNTTTGSLLGNLTWTDSDPGTGYLPGPLWLNDVQFIIISSDKGPLLVTHGELINIQPIAETFFDTPGNAQQYATGLGIKDSLGYHILFTEFLNENTSERTRLFHSENHVTEEISLPEAEFSKNGQWLYLIKHVNVDGYEKYEGWLRAIDPPGASAIQYRTTDAQICPGWSPDGQFVAIASPTWDRHVAISIHTIPDGKLIETWTVRKYSYQFSWSPDNHFLVAQGWYQVGEENESVIYIFKVSSTGY